MTSPLFSSFRLREMEVRNRLMMSPMSQNSATEAGEATNWHMVHYGSRAVGGCGIVLMEDTAVAESGRVSSRSLCLYDERHAVALRDIVSFCQANGAKVGIQLAHAGRKAWRDRRLDDVGRVSTDEERFADDWGRPRTLEQEEILAIVEDFVTSAHLALMAGFDFIEIHAAHGYLIHQFLSPLSNRRTDTFGGDCKGRERLLFEIVNAVRKVWPIDRPLLCRLPAQDGHAKGLDEQTIVEIAGRLGQSGVDMVDVAASNVSPACETILPAHMHSAAKQIRAAHNLPTTTAGAKDAEHANELLSNGTMDVIAIGRPLLTNPYWALSLAQEDDRTAIWPKQYVLAMPKAG